MTTETLQIQMPDSSGGPYTTMIKELTETLDIMRHWGTDIEQLAKGVATLLVNEIKLQTMIQEDIIKDYEAEKAKQEIKDNNVTPIKKKDK